jgi:hypothetical protein
VATATTDAAGTGCTCCAGCAEGDVGTGTGTGTGGCGITDGAGTEEAGSDGWAAVHPLSSVHIPPHDWTVARE